MIDRRLVQNRSLALFEIFIILCASRMVVEKFISIIIIVQYSNSKHLSPLNEASLGRIISRNKIRISKNCSVFQNKLSKLPRLSSFLFSKTNYPNYFCSPLFYFPKQIIQTSSALLFSIFQNKLSKLARLSSFLFSNKRLLVRTCRTMH